MAARAAAALARFAALCCLAPAAADRGGLLARLDVLSALMHPRPKFAAVEGHTHGGSSGGGLRHGSSSAHHSDKNRHDGAGGALSVPPPSLVACTLVKDSMNAAQQWVAFLVLQGVDQVVLYDDLSPPRASPPLAPADFGGLAPWVEVTPWRGPDIPQNHLQGLRQAAAFRHCANRFAGSNATRVLIADVDEYVYPCAAAATGGSGDAAPTLLELLQAPPPHGAGDPVDAALDACPRFAAADGAYDDGVPVLSQLTARAPVSRLREPERAVFAVHPGCATRLWAEQYPCYGATKDKHIFVPGRMTATERDHLGTHGVTDPRLVTSHRPVAVTRSRASGICCNHYFVRSFAEAAAKFAANKNDLYEKYGALPDVHAFYRWANDTGAADRFSGPLVALLQRAGLPFRTREEAAAEVTTRVSAAPSPLPTASALPEPAAVPTATVQPPPSLVACTLVKDSLNAAQQWAAFMVLQGVDRLVFYDDVTPPRSAPPMTVGDFGGLAPWVEVMPWTGPDRGDSQLMFNRQLMAFRHCANRFATSNATRVLLVDVDEYVYPCNGGSSSDANATLAGLLRATEPATVNVVLSGCPRFAALGGHYDDGAPVLSQLTYRAPTGKLGEPERSWRSSLLGCAAPSRDEILGPCFGASFDKHAYIPGRMTQRERDAIEVHGVPRARGAPPLSFTPRVVTTSRTAGVCCNHYFARSVDEAAVKAAANRNDFYELYVNSSDVRRFYAWRHDTALRDRYGDALVALLQWAGLPFHAPALTPPAPSVLPTPSRSAHPDACARLLRRPSPSTATGSSASRRGAHAPPGRRFAVFVTADCVAGATATAIGTRPFVTAAASRAYDVLVVDHSPGNNCAGLLPLVDGVAHVPRSYKFDGLLTLLRACPALASAYDRVCFADDDLDFEGGPAGALDAFLMATAANLSLALPALARYQRGYFSHAVTVAVAHNSSSGGAPAPNMRLTGFVEVMVPMMDAWALSALLPLFANVTNAWGTEIAFIRTLQAGGRGRAIGVLDGVRAFHLKQQSMNATLYARSGGLAAAGASLLAYQRAYNWTDKDWATVRQRGGGTPVFIDIAPLKCEAWLRGLAGYDEGGDTTPPAAVTVGGAALLIPTHKWSPALQAGLAPFVTSATAAGLSVFILRMPRLSDAQLGRPAHIRSGDDASDGRVAGSSSTHGNDDAWQPPTLPGVAVLSVGAGELAGLYRAGYISPWVNTHHALLWFWARHGRASGLARVWVVEGDVRAVCDVGALWRHAPAADFVSTTPIAPLPADHWATWQWRGPKPTRPLIAFKQLYAASAPFLDFLDARCASGRNGQDEALLATAAVEFGGAVADLAPFLDASWSWDPRLEAAARAAWANATAAAAAGGGSGAVLRLFHPIKH